MYTIGSFDFIDKQQQVIQIYFYINRYRKF